MAVGSLDPHTNWLSSPVDGGMIMANGSNMFDEYGRKAQLYPALLGLMPALVTAFVMFPQLISLKGSVGAIIIGCGTLYLLANIAREAGRRKQGSLFPDGMPTEQLLRHRDHALDSQTKDRYKRYLLSNVPGLRLPTAEDEEADPQTADRDYRSAVKWMLDNTRDNQRVMQENIAYGFRRNLFGLRIWAITITLAMGTLAAVIIWHRHKTDLLATGPEMLLVVFVDLLVLPAIWLWVVTQKWVRSAAEGYAYALLGTCDDNKKSSEV